jgi:integrase/recombinase XerD
VAVFKRRICTACKHEARDSRLQKTLPPCARCGAETKYAPSWYVSVRVRTTGGLRPVTKAVKGNKDDAEKEERRLLGERDNGAVERVGVKTDFKHVAGVFRAWVEERREQGKLAAGTARPYQYRLTAHLEPWFGVCDVRQIDHDAADRYVRERRTAGVKPATINREVATLKRMLSVAVKKRLIGVNPLAGYELLPENNCRDTHLSREQIASLLSEAAKPKYPKHLLPMTVLALNSGLRMDGVLTLRWEEIDWRRNELHKIVKGGTEVRVPMTPALRKTLEDWRDRDGVRRASGFLFPSTRRPRKTDKASGEAMLVTSNLGFRTLFLAVGLKDFRRHDFRHTFATLFLEQYPDKIEVLRVLLGHTSAYITRRYAHITDRAKHETMGTFDVGGG